MAIDIQDIINKKTNHLLELLKQKKEVVKEEPDEENTDNEDIDEENTRPSIEIKEDRQMTDIVERKIEQILKLLREKKNKTDNVKTLVETSLSVLLGVLNQRRIKSAPADSHSSWSMTDKDLNNQGKNEELVPGKFEESFSEIAKAILNEEDINNPIEENKQPVSPEKTPVLTDLALELYSSMLKSVGDKIIRDEIKKAKELAESLKRQVITTNNVEQLVNISTKILQEISNTVSQAPSGQDIQPVIEPSDEKDVEPVVEKELQSSPASTYYNSMIKKNSDIGTFLAAAIGNALIDNKPTMIQNILAGLTKTGVVFKNYFKGIDMNAMKARLTNLSLPSPTLPNVKLSLPATNDIFRLTIGYPLAFIKYCAEQGIKIPQDIIDKFKQQVATTLDPNAGEKPVVETHMEDADKKKTEKDTDTPQKEVNCSDPITIKLGQVEDTALCFDPKQNKVIATK